MSALDNVLARLTSTYGEGLLGRVAAVGHRVVHGGTLSKSLLVNPAVLAAIDKAAVFAPLHNPANAQGIRAAEALFGDNTPQVPTTHTELTLCLPHRLQSFKLVSMARFGSNFARHNLGVDFAAPLARGSK